uniref:hypothetical protein n=1 Tax=Salmonella enterica TaxID=28901 RepID=UPI001957EA95
SHQIHSTKRVILQHDQHVEYLTPHEMREIIRFKYTGGFSGRNPAVSKKYYCTDKDIHVTVAELLHSI